jgi:hypothetical protein
MIDSCHLENEPPQTCGGSKHAALSFETLNRLLANLRL